MIRVKVKGSNIAYCEKGADEAIVLLHGDGSDKSQKIRTKVNKYVVVMSRGVAR